MSHQVIDINKIRVTQNLSVIKSAISFSLPIEVDSKIFLILNFSSLITNKEVLEAICKGININISSSENEINI